MIIDTLIKGIQEKDNPTVVGLDTSFDYLPEEMRAGVADRKGAAEAIFAFNKKLIDAVADVVPAVKARRCYRKCCCRRVCAGSPRTVRKPFRPVFLH